MIKGLKDSLERLCEENKAHLGLHYVGSFNELNSCSADDLESIVKEERSKRSQSAGGGGSMSKASSLHEQEQYEGAMSKQADIHEVNKSQHGQNRATWNAVPHTP